MSTRAFAIIAIAIAAGAIIWLAVGGLGENLVYYWSPTELNTAGDTGGGVIRLGGLVKVGSIERSEGAADTTFTVTDGAHDVRVRTTGIPPQMFRENIGVVVEGQLDGAGVFQSERIMVKHGEEYQAPEDGEKPPMAASGDEAGYPR